jgi:hypothetical protein
LQIPLSQLELGKLPQKAAYLAQATALQVDRGIHKPGVCICYPFVVDSLDAGKLCADVCATILHGGQAPDGVVRANL